MRILKKIALPLFFVVALSIMLSACKKDENNKKNPIITWANPADINYGTMLSVIQYNATADVPGTFVYKPAIGSVLPVGANQKLSVNFIPTDGGTYNAVSKDVLINVLPAGQSFANFNPTATYGTLIDIDGNVYKTIVIGTQTWMAQNLCTTRYRNGDSIPEVRDNTAWKNLNADAYCNYQNIKDKDTIATMGRLYNWFAVSSNKNLAPEGWHVATDADYTSLSTFLGGDATCGGKMKESGIAHWKTPNTGATNEIGFTAFPAGRREYTDGSFINIGFDAFLWTSSAYNPDYSWYRYLDYNTTSVNRANFHKQYGFSVRCVKD
ncbi:MAG: fibrobacter succinogenes major paralogous domain-containing protein [Bacteroidota bacterium]